MIKVICEMCNKEVPMIESSGWEIQTLHFADDELEMLTCETCKLKSPTEILKFLSEKEDNLTSHKAKADFTEGI